MRAILAAAGFVIGWTGTGWLLRRRKLRLAFAELRESDALLRQAFGELAELAELCPQVPE